MTADHPLLAGLDPEQRKVALHLDGPLVVLAGAGTGKTRAMTHRIAYGIATGSLRTHDVLALTFTAKAAGEMRSRLRGLGVPGVQARTFHSAALRQLRYFWPQFAEGPFPELQSQKAPLIGRAMSGLGIEPERETVRDVAAEVEYAAVSMLSVEDYVRAAEHRDLPDGVDAEAMGRIMVRYGELKTERRYIDFEDVLLVLTGVLGTREDIAAQVRSQYRSFVVDEFQDVSPLQYDLLMRWLGDRDSLCVVGDPAQTIYSFAGATDGFLRRLPVEFPQAETIRLVRNYRSTDPIVAAANAVLRHTGAGALQLRGSGRGGPAPAFEEYDDDLAEAESVAAAIADEIAAGRSASDIAVLFRTNAQSRTFEEALSARGIGFVVRGGERFFARREVKEAAAILRAASGRGHEGRLDEVVADILGSIGYSKEPPSAAGAVRERWESLSALVRLAEDLQRPSELPVPLADFISDLEDRAEHQFAPTIDGVTLASVHAAKGLEWGSVHLVGASEGLMPIGYADTLEAIAEERRLFYVAVTRAEERLTVSWSKGRRGSPHSSRRPSRFVSEIRTGSGERQPPSRSKRRRSSDVVRCRVCRRGLLSRAERARGRCDGCPADIDDAVLEALMHWRAEAAKRAKVPVFMVLTTETVRELAERLPEDEAALSSVSGIGPVKLSQFGEELLELIAQRRTRR